MANRVLTGTRFVHGDWACAEGAISAGCGYYAAYPITPATEIAERIAQRFPVLGGKFIQFEDEIGAIASVIGASFSGLKAMTATSGPGVSLMLENIGLAVMTEAPCVIVNVMRGGPSTGQPTMGAQGDVMQCRWGMHGDVETIALAPQSVQEMYDLTVEAFNLSEAYRTPVFLLSDANIGHLYERLTIPREEELTLVDRKRPTLPPSEYLPYRADESLVPPMASFGDGYRFYSTGLTHDEKGYPDMSVETQDKLVRRLCDKIRRNTDKITMVETLMTDDCEVLVVAYGIAARSAATAVKQARERGLKAGLLRLVSLWPFPDKLLEKMAEDAKAVIVAEMNYGQLVREVERAVKPKPVRFLPKLGENPHTPGEILEAIRRIDA
ncbi:2-oxoacid:acceptor oxidoreductase subunit alpha [Candidatus Bathyarchaeota archaeon]|jgi:2-oxoglutarate ferredoxin oxidoreductase subunit alpha|nr:2-oxoacid:acceptor oxidoreductase subunit alpha [Candidatus Bathyarchaeota archaeon]